MSHTILLIAGQPKAATTSLFAWLSEHPDISAGLLKELRFFLDDGYPLHSPKRFRGDNFDEYFTLFEQPLKRVLLDATPDYFACNAPLSVPIFNEDTKAVVVVREPVARMKSAYRFFKARGRIPKTMTFDEYVLKQYKGGITKSTPVQYRALDHCRTGYYLRAWREVYGANLLVLNFEDIQKNPETELLKIYRLVGLQATIGSERGSFKAANKTTAVKSAVLYRAYSELRRLISTKFMRVPLARKILSPMSKLINSLLTVDGSIEAIEPSSFTLTIISEESCK